MEIPTSKTQLKIAELLHDIGCADKPTTHLEDERDKCLDWPKYVTDSTFFLARLMQPISTEMFPAVRADERDKVAYYIVAELVCCDIHARLEAEAAKGHWDERTHQWVMPQSWRDLRRSGDYHPICHYGGWAASLAYHGPELDNRHDGWFKPWLLTGTIEVPRAPYVCKVSGGEAECKQTYYCPAAGEYESPCHGGFDTCCRRPELHRPNPERE